ncbi:MAG: RNA ligase family protein [Candidatus Woesearchaeota archaeon]
MRFAEFYNLDADKDLLLEVAQMTSIPHMHLLTVDQVLNFLGDNFSVDDWEITEKVDGANFSVGLIDGQVYGKSKRGKPFTDPQMFYELKDINDIFVAMGNLLNLMKQNGFKDWHDRILKKYEDDLKRRFKINIIKSLIIFGEIFNSNQVNTLVYSKEAIGNGAFVVFGVKIDDGSYKGIEISTDSIGLEIMRDFVDTFNETEGWKFYFKKSVKIEINKEFAKELEDFVKNNIEIIKNRKRSPEIVEKKNKAKEELASLLMKFKKDILRQTSEVKPLLGGKEIEGIVIRNIKTGGITKVVDVDKFTKINMQNWEFRKELKDERKELYKQLIDNIVKSADIFIIKSKQEEKLIDYLQNKGKNKFDSLDELINVLYEDAAEEVQLDSAAEVTNKMRNIIDNYINRVNKIKENTIANKGKGLDDKNYELTIKNLDQEIKEMNELKNRIEALNSEMKNPYTEIIKFILGNKGIEELTNKFINK